MGAEVVRYKGPNGKTQFMGRPRDFGMLLHDSIEAAAYGGGFDYGEFDMTSYAVSTRRELRRILRDASRRAHLFENEEIWVNAEGRYVPIEQMSARYAENTMRWLEEHAREDAEQIYLWNNRESMDEEEFEWDDAQCLAWLRETPLYNALRKASERPF